MNEQRRVERLAGLFDEVKGVGFASGRADAFADVMEKFISVDADTFGEFLSVEGQRSLEATTEKSEALARLIRGGE